MEAVVEALKAHPTDKAVQSNGSAAMGNICYAADYAGLRRKQAAYSAGAIDPIVGALAQYTDDTSVCENGAFALGNLCRALGKVGGNNDAPPKEGAPELAPIDEQMRLREEGAARKAAAAEARSGGARGRDAKAFGQRLPAGVGRARALDYYVRVEPAAREGEGGGRKDGVVDGPVGGYGPWRHQARSDDVEDGTCAQRSRKRTATTGGSAGDGAARAASEAILGDFVRRYSVSCARAARRWFRRW